jgi:hypothetical protein
MVSFKDVVTPEHAEALRQYVILQAQRADVTAAQDDPGPVQ